MVLRLTALITALVGPAQGVVLFQSDTFSGGTSGWGGSRFSPPPAVVAGGPAGPSDPFLQVSAASFHLGSKNEGQWTGNYLSDGVNTITFDANLLGPDSISIRILLFGPGGAFATNAITPLTVASGWQRLSFSIDPADLIYVPPGANGMVGTMVATDTLSNVDRFLIRNDRITPTPIGDHPPHVTTMIGLDNITAVPEPHAALLALLACGTFLQRRR